MKPLLQNGRTASWEALEVNRAVVWLLLASGALQGSAGCRAPEVRRHAAPVELLEVAVSPRRWTGVAVSREGRIFVNYPRWSEDATTSVEEILPAKGTRAYPDSVWNLWSSGRSPAESFVCVQSVHVDAANRLWILDPANPLFAGVVPGGAKLVQVDLATDRVARAIVFDASVAPEQSYLNDVRVDAQREVAYITDSGLGALIVVDLRTGTARRRLEAHPSTKAEKVVLTVGGREWRLADGSAPRVHADGIALSADGEVLFYQALTGRTLYRIRTRWLRDDSLDEGELGGRVERVARSGAADGILLGPRGELWLTALEEDAIKRRGRRGRIETVLRDPRLAWPDSLAIGPGGAVYVTTSRIHLAGEEGRPYGLFRFRP